MFPLWLLGVVVLFAVFGDYAIFVSCGRRLGGASAAVARVNPIDDPDADVNYWRFRRPGVRRHDSIVDLPPRATAGLNLLPGTGP